MPVANTETDMYAFVLTLSTHCTQELHELFLLMQIKLTEIICDDLSMGSSLGIFKLLSWLHFVK